MFPVWFHVQVSVVAPAGYVIVSWHFGEQSEQMGKCVVVKVYIRYNNE